jgi:MFS family permease
MPLLVGWLISKYDWQTACLGVAGALILVGIPVSAIIMRAPQARKLPTELRRQRELKTEDVSAGQALRRKSFWMVSISVMLWLCAYTIGLTHQVAFAVDMGIDRVAAAGAVSLLCVFSIPARIGFGKLGDIMDKRYVVMMGAGLQAAAFVILLQTTSLAMLYLYAAVVGIAAGGLTPIVPGLVADYFGRRHFGAIYGAVEMVTTLGQMVGPVYGGWIYDVSKSYDSAFLSGIVIALLAVVLIYVVPKAHLH